MPADLSKEKLQLIEWILKQDQTASLKPLKEAITAMEQDVADTNRIVGQRSRGLRVTRKQLVERLIEAIRTLDEMPLVSLETLEQDSDKW